jgi:acetyltransferase-like isoleucine patch superfamily enzyme
VTNDRFPLRRRDEYRPEGCTVEDNVTIGGGVVLCPGVTIGAGSFVAAGAIVTKNVPADSLAIGAPARIEPLPDKLREPNMALSWRPHLEAKNGR